MVELTIDGQKVEVPEGSMVMHAAHALGVQVPHFCYHKKLSIAANCRMCLVEVEKAPKPMPACATPVTQGMIVHTKSDKAVKAQKSVMEFLLINHPLDCPICDQGGECQLQDIAVGYGGSSSRYAEEKRVVFHKDLGPLVSAEEMSRCIHCTRCVRFGQEIAGVMELGMLNRGEHSEITSFVGRAVESELSGNMIDICPVGALTSKPFRYSARTWELARRRSVSPHDSLGANLVVQVKNNQVLRVVPFENEAVNECWISDRDRFSYEGLNSADRLQVPMIRGADGQWREADWAEALEFAANELGRIRADHGAGEIGALATQYATLEEMALLARLVRGLGSDNLDARLLREDASLDAAFAGAPWLGMSITEFAALDRVAVIGSFLRKDHPLLAQRLRQSTKRGTRLALLDVAADDPLMPVAARQTVLPSQLAGALSELLVAVAQQQGAAVPAGFESVQPSAAVQSMAKALVGGVKTGVFLGNYALNHPQAGQIAALAQALAHALGGTLGVLGESGNSVGASLTGLQPQGQGKSAAAMVKAMPRGMIVLHAEPGRDMAQGAQAEAALRGAFSVALTPFRSAAESWASVMLPIAPFTETSGTFINTAGEAQSFHATVKPLGQTRPGWKVLRVLANIMALPGFQQESSEAVRDEVLGQGSVASRLNSTVTVAPAPVALSAASGLERVAEVPIYHSDAVVRRAESLQAAPAAKVAAVRVHPDTAAKLGLTGAAQVRVKGLATPLSFATDASLPAGAVRIPLGLSSTVAVGAAHGRVELERA